MYSQNKEEEVILKYFDGKRGNFLDIGANDGKTLSNVRALAELGWGGVFVEPSPKAFERLKANYDGLKGFYFYQVAIGNGNNKCFLQESASLCSPSDVALVSTLHASEMARFKSITKYTPVEIQMYTWRTFLNRLTIKKFDMITMDCEGSELDILPDMDLTHTKLICIEHNGKEQLKEEYEKYLSEFKLIYTSGENLIYVK